MIIDITKQIGNNHYQQKNEVLTEIISWLHVNLGEYYGYSGDTSLKPYKYAIGKGWQILIYEHPEQDPSIWNNRLTWIVEIDNIAIAEMFILKFL